MPLSPDAFDDATPRFERFERLFLAHDTVGDSMNEVLDHEQPKMRVRDGPDRILSIVMAAALGRAMKTFQAVQRLCLLGFGEDALVALRSQINLLINVGYIVGDPEPRERAKDFAAYSYREWEKYLMEAHDHVPWEEPLFERDELNRRAGQWKKTTIRSRAKRVSALHYTTAYRFYSSLEHADVMALFGYITEWDEVGPQIGSGPSDSHVEVALQHNLMVMADMLDVVCRYHGIERPDVFTRLTTMFAKLGLAGEQKPPASSAS